ncbi:hypothetical protein LJC22_06335 [Desulfosarcina sp. OttesenSCG-928-G10]|nr:hypothetical protein [Desulfosarcina sp. OttesenSCG-928-G10]MDL2321254.1 hypothetical protein [Desulfosarcina sp. OttesenSCG-928-B08]
MKQKYVILLDSGNNRLLIQEHAELDKEALSLLCEETYDAKLLQSAMEKDRGALIQALRTHNMYPPGTYIERIADAVIGMFAPGADPSAELFFEEREMFDRMDEDLLVDTDAVADEEATMDVDDLLDEDIEDDFEDKSLLKSIDNPVHLG